MNSNKSKYYFFNYLYMMRNLYTSLIRTVSFNLGRFFSFTYIINKNLSFLKDIIYTGYISSKFNTFGNKSVIRRKILYLHNPKCISVGDDVVIGKYVTLSAWTKYQNQSFNPKIIIGNGSSIGDESHITCINEIKIGNNVRSGKRILITDNAHGASDYSLLAISPIKRPLASKGPVIIEDNVWIGEKASIMPGVHIGFGSIIAANSVVTKDIPPFCVAAGVPAKVIKIMKE